MSPARFFTPRGRIERAPYLVYGLILLALKLSLDAAVCLLVFHQPWHWSDYLRPQSLLMAAGHRITPAFAWTMLTVAAPFAWMGICLTTQRLRAVRAPIWLVLLFFIPFLKVALIALLVLLPSRSENAPAPVPAPPAGWRSGLPESAFGSAALAVFVAALFGALCVGLSLRWRHAYVESIFIGTPFFIGFLGALLHETRRPRPLREAIGVALLALFMVGAVLVAVAFEGILCIVMAAPLALCEAVVGACVAHGFGAALRGRGAATFSFLALMPLLMLTENSAPSPPLISVTSEVVIDAPPAQVWPHVIGFAAIPPPHELIFRAGIAFPVRAVIEGRGVGAVRHCIFSTGEFLEPITVWEEPVHLAFDVAAQPDPLEELSPYRHLQTPHLRGYFKSARGEFHLIALSGGRTLLRGTTWYSDRIEPQVYWRFWSDLIIHRIHLRVLDHIRAESERSGTAAL